MNPSTNPRRLSNAQALLLQLFERDLSESELTDVRQVLTKHFAQKAEAEAERILKLRKQSAKQVEQDSIVINENRTEYLQQLRSTNQ
ncbi:hypothetical protein GO755_13425 [Spirosoma sp. HMF4905]|uniref:Uncharacterized protein n=1 Tax=Spirosoma arboris TaxID=2682092 RepID=A0A7K1SB94_9BACT|nr:hypothetical protein [Spirosoma arboris]MVM31035.1 hypothetical protein [Spirosoma arboris]